MATPERFIAPTAEGVFAWLAQPERSTARDLFEHVMQSDALQPLDVRQISTQLCCPVVEVSKALFQLNRMHSIKVSLTALPAFDTTITSLDAVLAAVHPSQRLALVTHDGFCLAAHAINHADADKLASQPDATWRQATFYFQHETVGVLSDQPLHQSLPAWVTLVGQLVQLCGALKAQSHHAL
jgi:hypothetical protein